jgi:hypothetical protein
VLASLQADELEQLLDPRLLMLGRYAVELGEVAQIVVAREPLVDAALPAEDVADPLAYLACLLHHVEPEHPCLPAGWDQQRDQHLDRGRLAGPVRPEQPEELALGDLEVDAANGLDLERLPADDAGRRLVGP